MAVQIAAQSFSPAAELESFLTECAGAGAVVTFTGLVRATPASQLRTLRLECYLELASQQLADLEKSAFAKFNILRCAIIHRYGELQPGEAIVQVMTQAAHRHDAFNAAAYLMDFLKTDAAFWKKESTGSGEYWVDSTTSDENARNNWNKTKEAT